MSQQGIYKLLFINGMNATNRIWWSSVIWEDYYRRCYQWPVSILRSSDFIR